MTNNLNVSKDGIALVGNEEGMHTAIKFNE